jgi:hypothetical protein
LFEVDGVWACSACHQLDWSSQHTHRSIPELHRIVWLRKRLGADPRPFDPEIIVDAIADGLSIPEAAQRFDLAENEVRGILKEATERCYDGTYMREAWMLEARRLAAVGLKFYRKAMDDSDPQELRR